MVWGSVCPGETSCFILCPSTTPSVPLSEAVKKIILLYNVSLGRHLSLYFKAINILWHYFGVAFESLDCNNNCQGCIYTTSVMNIFDSK